MPIRPENRGRYPKDWPAIRARILARASNACECVGECGQEHPAGSRGRVLFRDGKPACGAPNGVWIARLREEPAIWHYTEGDTLDEVRRKERGDALVVGSDLPYDPFLDPLKVVLTIAHLDHVPEHCDDGNLLALCQRCHLLLDKAEHRESARIARDRKRGQGSLFEGPGGRR